MNNDSGVIDKVLLSCIATLLFSDAIAQPASIGCSSRVWDFPTSIFATQKKQIYTSALLATMVLVLRSSQPVSDTDAQTQATMKMC